MVKQPVASSEVPPHVKHLEWGRVTFDPREVFRLAAETELVPLAQQISRGPGPLPLNCC